MVIDWVIVGWIIDLVLNGIVWLIIAVFLITLIDVTDSWTRKAIRLMDLADKWSRNVIEKSFEWIQKKNLKILFAFLLMLLLGILAQFEIIPKLIT